MKVNLIKLLYMLYMFVYIVLIKPYKELIIAIISVHKCADE